MNWLLIASRSEASRYGVAVALVVAATIVRFLLDPYLGDRVPFITYFAAIAASVWYGRFWSGVLATVLSCAAGLWFFIPPRLTFSFLGTDTAAWTTLSTFLLVGLVIAGASEAMHRTRVQLEKAAGELLESSAATEAQREWLQVVLRSIGDAVIATDDTGRVSFLNPITEELTGWSEEEARNRPFAEVFDIVNERTGARVEDPCEKVLRLGRIVGLANHTVLISRDGVRRPIDDSAAPITDRNGRILGVVVVFRDATEERRAFENMERLAALVEHSDDVIVAKLLDGTITSWNAAAERLYGYRAEEAVGRNISILVPPDRRQELDTIMDQLRAGKPTERLETVRMRMDGSLVDMSITVSPIKNTYGEIVGASTIGRYVGRERKAQEALRLSEERLRLALNAGRLGVWDWELSSGRLTWTDTLYEIHGVDPGEFGGTAEDFRRLVHPEDAAHVSDAIERALAGESDYDMEFRIVRPSGEVRWVFTSGRVLRDDGGRAQRMLGATLDTTERKGAEQTLEFLKEASDAVAFLVDVESTMQRLTRLAVPFFADWALTHLVNDRGEIRRVARAHADPEQEAVLEELSSRYPPDWTRPSAIVRVLKTGRPEFSPGLSRAQVEALATDSRHRDMLERLRLRSLIVVPLERRGSPMGAMSFMRSGAREPYTSRDVDLARELAGRASTAIDNSRLYEELKETDRQKDEFLAMLAHELRNPLAAIDYAIRLLEASPEHAESVVEVVKRQVGQLSRLMDDLLDVSRITSNKIQLQREPIDAATLVRRAVATARPLFEQQDHELLLEIAEERMPLFVDPTRAEQIVVNLLTNAAKYTPRGGRVRVQTFSEDDEAVIRVEDSGIGIRPEMLPRIFELFTQLEPTIARTQGGLGIGLPVVRRLVEMHGGSVSATSAGPDQGSVFTVRLPLDDGVPEDAGKARSSPELRPGLRILVVDDSTDTATSSSLLLETLGCITFQAHDGLTAIEAARSFRPDAVLLDIGLPGIDGYEVARRIRADPELSSVKLIAVSGYGQPRDQERSREAGFDHHFTKPLKLERLFEVLGGPGDGEPDRSRG